MADTVISPNMNLPVPTVSTCPGPDWATDINACLDLVDSHDHSSGNGVQITPDGLNINAALPMNGNNLTTANSVGFSALVAAVTSLLRSLQVVSKDLFFIDGDGNSVRITQSGSVTGSSGTITGLPSGTASASFSGGTFTWQSATNTPATMDMGPAIIRSTTAGSKGVTQSARSSQAANYNLFFPLVAPAANQIQVSDGSGNLSWSFGLLPIGSVVATFPNLTGAYSSSGTTAADAYGFVRCVGQTIGDATSPMNGQVVPNINNSIFLLGSTTAGTSGGSATASGVGAHTHTFSSTDTWPTNAHTHVFSHTHQWGAIDGTNVPNLFVRVSSDPTSTGVSTSNSRYLDRLTGSIGGGASIYAASFITSTENLYTAGVVGSSGGSGATAVTAGPSPTGNVTGTTASSGTSFAILPPYISAVYLMRIV